MIEVTAQYIQIMLLSLLYIFLGFIIYIGIYNMIADLKERVISNSADKLAENIDEEDLELEEIQ